MAPAPYLGVPLLKGYLQQYGIECATADFNVRFLRWFLRDRQILDDWIDQAAAGYKILQAKPTLTPPETAAYEEKAAALAVAPRDLLIKHFGGDPLFGSRQAPSTDSWTGHFARLVNGLAMTGIYIDYIEKEASQKSATASKINFFKRYEALETFFQTEESRSLLRQAAAAGVVGISIPFFEQQALAGLLIAQHVRRLNPKAFIIFGGPGLSKNVRAFQKMISDFRAEVNAIALYEGELTLQRLAEAVAEEKNPDQVPNILLADAQTGAFKATEHRPSPGLDELPTPIFEADELKMYCELAGDCYAGVRLPLLISRGCWWDRCAFCSDKLFRHPQTPAYQPRKPEKVIADIEQLQRLHGATYFYLITAAMAPGWGRRFAQGILERGVTAKFWSYMRATDEKTAGRDYFVLLKKAGFDMITVGVESTVDRVLEAVDKGNTSRDVVHTLQGLGLAGVRTKFNLIADLPPGTLEDARSNWDFLLTHLEHVHDLTVFEYGLMEGTPMALQPEKFNLKIVRDENGAPRLISPGIIRHVNAFYENPEAPAMVKRFKNLSRDIEFLQLTAPLRRKIKIEDHCWSNSIFIFRPFSAFPAHFAPGENIPRNLIYVVLDDIFKYAIVPAEFYEFIDWMKQGVSTPIAYPKLLEEFLSGLRKLNPAAPDDQGAGTLSGILRRMIRDGFVLDILDDHLQESLGDRPRPINPQEDLPMVYDRYPIRCPPFLFGAFAFAGVPQTKMS